MLLKSMPYDHTLQLTTITCRHNNKLQRYSADFPSLSSTNSDFELTLTLIEYFLPALPFLLGICPRSRWSPPFPLYAPAPILLSLAKVLLSPTLTLSFVIWYSGLTTLFLFLLAKAAPASLPTALSVALRPLFPFRPAQPLCSSFSAEACAILHALCWSRQHQQVCHFSSLLLLTDSRSILATLSSPTSFLIPETLWQKLSSLSCSIRLQWVPGH